MKRDFFVSQRTSITENDIVSKDLLDGNIKLDQLVLMFELAMESSDIEVKRSALNVICRVCRHVGFSFCRIATRIIRLIQETKDIPEKWRWKTYYQLNEVLGIGSMLYTRFSDFVGVLARNLHDDSVPEDLVLLVISLLKTSLPLLKSRSILELQSVVCTKALCFQPTINSLKLLNVLLQFNHDEVPIPLQIAQSVFNRYFTDNRTNFIAEIEYGRTLTSIYSHPKLPLFLTKLISNDKVSSTDDQSSSNLTKLALLPSREDLKIEGNKETTDVKKSENQSITEIRTIESEVDSIEVLSADQMLSFFNPE